MERRRCIKSRARDSNNNSTECFTFYSTCQLPNRLASNGFGRHSFTCSWKTGQDNTEPSEVDSRRTLMDTYWKLNYIVFHQKCFRQWEIVDFVSRIYFLIWCEKFAGTCCYFFPYYWPWEVLFFWSFLRPSPWQSLGHAIHKLTFQVVIIYLKFEASLRLNCKKAQKIQKSNIGTF
jgi:hypothetical protein